MFEDPPEYIVSTVGYTQEQLDAAVEAAIEATKEKAAKVCEETEYCSLTSEERPMLWFECAAAIRSMK